MEGGVDSNWKCSHANWSRHQENDRVDEIVERVFEDEALDELGVQGELSLDSGVQAEGERGGGCKILSN